MPDFGKSSLTKSWLYRSRVFGRRCEIIDPKGEYSELVQALGGVVLRLSPGGATRLNPLTRIGTPEMREGLLQAVAHAMLGRPSPRPRRSGSSRPSPPPTSTHDGEVCIRHVVDQLRDPAERTHHALDMTRDGAREQLRELALALMRLCHGPLRGMFDAPTSARGRLGRPGRLAWISRRSPRAAPPRTSRWRSRWSARPRSLTHNACSAPAGDRPGAEAPKTIRVNDEAWRALPIAGLGEYYQAAFKLGRQTGVQHWMVLHRLSDLDAAGDAGTRQQALAKGLLAETGTVIVYRQHPEEAAARHPSSGSQDRDRSASATTRRASRCGGSAGAPTRSATSAQSASGRSPPPTQAMADREPAHAPPRRTSSSEGTT